MFAKDYQPTRLVRLKWVALLVVIASAVSCATKARTDDTGITLTDATGAQVTIKDASRIVAAGGSVTETLYALGVGDRLVGADETSYYPEAAAKLPKVGYVRQLASEGMLSLRPTLIITTTQAGPPAALDQLRASGVPVLIVSGQEAATGVKDKVRLIAKAVGAEAKGETLVQEIESDFAKLDAALKNISTRPKVMFIYARGQGAPTVSGTKTGADEMIQLAGGTNAITGYENYKPLTPEAAVAAAPDVVLMLQRGLDEIGGVDGLLKQPGIALTPAGKQRRVVALDDMYLLGYGPRIGKAALDLAKEFHPQLRPSLAEAK